jgi:hypothetical protein
MPITIVIAMVAIVVALIIVAVITTPIVALIVGTEILLVGVRSPTNDFLDLLVSLISACPLLHHHEQV